MATRTFNTKSPTMKRILSESKEMSRHPDPSLTAHPLESNLFEWHFTIAGPPSSPYENGIYHGRIILPPTYPLRPPMFRFTTPSGRFETNREICLSISGHHEETWQPAWGIRTALAAIRVFMESNAAGQVGGLEVGEEPRRRIAGESRAWRCPTCERSNEEIMKECKDRWQQAREKGEVQEGSTETVPEELRLAYKEDLTAEKKEDSGEGLASEQPNNEISQVPRAENGAAVMPSAQTQMQGRTSAAPEPNTTPSDLLPASSARDESTAVTPTIAPTRTVAQVQTVSTDDGVPAWVDKAIFGVLLSLVVMLLRRMLA